MSVSFSHWLCSFWPQELGTSCFLCLEHYFPAFCLLNSSTTFRYQLRCHVLQELFPTCSPHSGLDALVPPPIGPFVSPVIAPLPYYCFFLFFFFLRRTFALVAQAGVQWQNLGSPQPQRLVFSSITLLSSQDYRNALACLATFVFLGEMGFHHVDQDGLHLLTL